MLLLMVGIGGKGFKHLHFPKIPFHTRDQRGDTSQKFVATLILTRVLIFFIIFYFFKLKTHLPLKQLPVVGWEEKWQKHKIFKSTFYFSVSPSKKKVGYLWLLTPH